MIDHSKCTHTRDRAGRSACRAGRAQPAVQTDTQVIDALRTSERLGITQTAILAAADRIMINPAATRGKIRRTPIRLLTQMAHEIFEADSELTMNSIHEQVARQVSRLP